MPTESRGIVHGLFNGAAFLEDFADRLNHVWTVGLLLLLAAAISYKQGTSKPIICNTNDFTPNMAEYVDNVCWHSHAIRYPKDVDVNSKQYLTYSSWWHDHDLLIPVVTDSTVEAAPYSYPYDDGRIFGILANVTMYQWLPIILSLQALLFKLPFIVVHVAHVFSGLNFEGLRGLTAGYDRLNVTDQRKMVAMIAKYLYRWCKQFDNCPPWRWLTLTWCVAKCLYCSNIVAQLFTLDKFLHTGTSNFNHSTYGEVMGGNIFSNNATLLRFAHQFPREIRCDVELELDHNIRSLQTQCALPINSFNETVFMLLWAWFVFVAMVTVVSLLVWLLRTGFPCLRRRYIMDMMFLEDTIDVCSLQNEHVDQLVKTVGEDGVMALKLIGANSSSRVVQSVVWNMWLLNQTEIRGRDLEKSRVEHSRQRH